MSTSRRAKQAQRAVAILEHVQLQGELAPPSRLATLIEQGGKPTKRQQAIAVETVTRAGSIEATGLLHEWASGHIARAHLTSNHHVHQTVRRINAVLAAPTDPLTAEDMGAWSIAQKEMLFRHEATLLDGMATQMSKIATKPLPDKEEPESLLDKLFGRR